MRNPGGYVCISGPDGTREADSFTCFHCSRVVVVRARTSPTDAGGMCGVCAKMICPACVDEGVCHPFEKKLEAAEASYHARRSYGLAS